MIEETQPKIVRPPAVASMFYPGKAEELLDSVRVFLSDAFSNKSPCEFNNNENSILRALIVPHAGYVYSGKIAASAYQLLQQNKNQFKRVLLLGPAHRMWVQGAAFPTEEVFETPLGSINLDKKRMKKLSEDFPWISFNKKVHAEEHCLEVQLPFLQEILVDFELIPLLFGEIDTLQIAEMIQQYGTDLETLILISTDLSHYLDYETACKKDAITANAIELLEPQKISSEDACGVYPLKGALIAASKNKWKVHRLGLCNSGDTSGNLGRVVGYGAWALTA